MKRPITRLQEIIWQGSQRVACSTEEIFLTPGACNFPVARYQYDGHWRLGWKRRIHTPPKNASGHKKAQWINVIVVNRCKARVWYYLPRMFRRSLGCSSSLPKTQKQTFTIGTDHHGLNLLLYVADATKKLARWRVRLSDMVFLVF